MNDILPVLGAAVGASTWTGPFTILDGSGGLTPRAWIERGKGPP